MHDFDTTGNSANFSTEVEKEWIGKEGKEDGKEEMKGGEMGGCVCYVK